MTNDPIEQQVLARVRELGFEHDVIEIDPALADTAEFCAHYGYAMEESANCIVVASRDEDPVVAACLVLATTRLDVNKRVRKLLGVRKLSFAPAELTMQVTGMMIGGVTPFGLPDDLPLYVDARIMELDRVIVGGGSRSIKLYVQPAALTAVGAEVIDDLALPSD
jgi:prolyl-tRNA editing enzyme YbaK/EbsC (Cys-tRNA(Pro) deacylase)